eukprot:TRINITY_DN32325_c0_g1_i3.p3 TRINITY_DN32325_c0_g1~~TRINITY_DN32325_c0_g1_i3.p3  ORF type:complete len:269 (-),score=17.46 TRINITY_DN32325_c0_g1_i3:1007-1813(-)
MDKLTVSHLKTVHGPVQERALVKYPCDAAVVSALTKPAPNKRNRKRASSKNKKAPADGVTHVSAAAAAAALCGPASVPSGCAYMSGAPDYAAIPAPSDLLRLKGQSYHPWLRRARLRAGFRSRDADGWPFRRSNFAARARAVASPHVHRLRGIAGALRHHPCAAHTTRMQICVSCSAVCEIAGARRLQLRVTKACPAGSTGVHTYTPVAFSARSRELPLMSCLAMHSSARWLARLPVARTGQREGCCFVGIASCPCAQLQPCMLRMQL